MLATCTWRSAGSSKVELTTSPLTERAMSVTSSGRSSISRTIRYTSGWFVVIALAIFCRMTVLPARGGDTIRPRWPLPMGAIRLIRRVVMFLGSCSRFSICSGYSGVRLSNSVTFLALAGSL